MVSVACPERQWSATVWSIAQENKIGLDHFGMCRVALATCLPSSAVAKQDQYSVWHAQAGRPWLRTLVKQRSERRQQIAVSVVESEVENAAHRWNFHAGLDFGIRVLRQPRTWVMVEHCSRLGQLFSGEPSCAKSTKGSGKLCNGAEESMVPFLNRPVGVPGNAIAEQDKPCHFPPPHSGGP